MSHAAAARASVTRPQGVPLPLAADPPNLGIEWDAENRLTAVKEGANTLASFTYDGEGRRATKAAAGITTSFVYDGAQFLEERPSSGGMTRYVYGESIDDVLARQDATGTFYYLKDHLGSVRQVTNASSTAVVTRDYDPWGNLLAGSAEPAFAFTGREWDPEIDLYYYRARFYDANAGRFLSEDPIGDLNPYPYAGGSPTNYTDPFGLIKTKGFSPDDDRKMQEGAKKVEKKLKEEPCCTVGDPAQLIRLMNIATFVYKPNIIDKKTKRPLCGEVSNPLRWMQRRIHIGKSALQDGGACGPPECTILHEVTHLANASRDETEPYKNEYCCFGCGTGEVPEE